MEYKEISAALIVEAETLLDRKLTKLEIALAEYFAHNAIYQWEKQNR